MRPEDITPVHARLLDDMGAKLLENLRLWERSYPDSVRELRLAQTKVHEAMLWAREALNPTMK